MFLGVHDVPFEFDRFDQRFPPEDLVVEVVEIEVEIASDDCTAGVDEKIHVESVGMESEDGDVLGIFFGDEEESDLFYFEDHFF